MLQKIGASINSVIGRDLESGEFMWTEYDSLSPLAFPGQYFDRIVSEIRSFDFRIELNRYGPGIHLSVIKAADNEKLFNARRQSRNHHPIEVEISGMLNDAPEWYWEWKIRANEPGSWDWELDEYQIMIQWLTDIYQHCRDNDQLAFFTNLETTSKLDQIIKKARSTGIWPEVDEIVTV